MNKRSPINELQTQLGISDITELEKLAEIVVGGGFKGLKWRQIGVLLVLGPKHGVPFDYCFPQGVKETFIKVRRASSPEALAIFENTGPALTRSMRRKKQKQARKANSGAKRLKASIRPVKKQPPKLKDSAEEISAFYNSYAWAELRYSILVKFGRVCMCCGETRGVMNVDHIKPVRKYWELRLNPDNLQVLCPACNKGKNNWDETDFRPRLTNVVPLKILK